MVKVDVDLSGVKIPRKVAGMKVPKTLRKQGKRLIAKANSPEGREAIAAGLTIAATAIAGARAKGARVKAERESERARAAAAEVARAATAGGGRPGDPGIDPATDPAQQLSAAIGNGIAAFQAFLAGTKKG